MPGPIGQKSTGPLPKPGAPTNRGGRCNRSSLSNRRRRKAFPPPGPNRRLTASSLPNLPNAICNRALQQTGALAQLVERDGKSRRPVTGVPADLVLTPSLGWSALADTSFTIDSGGNLTPPGASLSQFLYGSQWNTQYKRPPVFHITHPTGGLFKVKTAAQTGQSPKIAVWLDGVKVLEQNAQVNQTYQISIPAGQHTIKVDNTGTDWITVTSYTFAGLGSAVDAYILKSPNQDKIAGWALNNSYNHAYINANGQPAPASGALLTVQNVKNGAYNARFYDCLTGSLLSTEALTVTNGTLALPLPDVLWDIAFYIDDQPFVAVEEAGRSQDFQLYPNPAAPGATLTLEFETRENAPLAITLLDMEGKAVRSLFSGDTTGGAQQMTIPLPADLAAGVYWVKMETGDGKIGARGVMVER